MSIKNYGSITKKKFVEEMVLNSTCFLGINRNLISHEKLGEIVSNLFDSKKQLNFRICIEKSVGLYFSDESLLTLSKDGYDHKYIKYFYSAYNILIADFYYIDGLGISHKYLYYLYLV